MNNEVGDRLMFVEVKPDLKNIQSKSNSVILSIKALKPRSIQTHFFKFELRLG